MRNKLKSVILTALLILAVCCLASCSPKEQRHSDKPTIVCSGFAQYDWVCSIIGEESNEWNVIRINDRGTDMHSYQPTAEDVMTISNCDLIVYTGGASEKWIEDIIEDGEFGGRKYRLISDENVKFVDEEGHEKHSHAEEDEHVWLSPENAITFCREITELLTEMDSPNGEIYLQNCQAYVSELQELDLSYERVIKTAQRKAVIVADRFPFRYLFEDYGILYFTAFPGCSAEAEASFETIASLSERLNEYDLNCVLVTEDGNSSIAETVIKNSRKKDAEILVMDSMQSVSSEDSEKSYIEVMQANLQTLEKALN